MAVTVNRFLKVNFGTLNFGNVDDIIRNESPINFLRFVIFSKVPKKDQKVLSGTLLFFTFKPIIMTFLSFTF